MNFPSDVHHWQPDTPPHLPMTLLTTSRPLARSFGVLLGKKSCVRPFSSSLPVSCFYATQNDATSDIQVPVMSIDNICDQLKYPVREGSLEADLIPASELMIHNEDVFLSEILEEMRQQMKVPKEMDLDADVDRLMIDKEPTAMTISSLEERDIDKDTPFATLAIQLPSVFQGGEMELQQEMEQSVHLDWASDSDKGIRWMAWKSPPSSSSIQRQALTSGARALLFYNVYQQDVSDYFDEMHELDDDEDDEEVAAQLELTI